MKDLFTIEGKVKKEFQEAISNNLYRVLQNCKIINLNITDHKTLQYDMMLQNIPELKIICNDKTFVYQTHTEIPEFTYIGGANY